MRDESSLLLNGLRDYGHDGQIGLEETPDEWAARLVAVFRECRRVLRDDGTLWVELGDSYNSGSSGCLGGSTLGGGTANQERSNRHGIGYLDGLKPKDLLGQPWLLAQALRDPWYGGEIKDEKDRVWLAATIDAEGCIAGNRHVRKDDGTVRTAIHISITNTSVALLDEASRIWPACRQQHDSREGSMGERPCWRWTATNVDKCSLLMRELYPHLIVKKRQAMLAYNFFEMSRQSKRLGKTTQGEEMRGRRDWIVAALSDLNRGRDIDVPPWIEEPPTLHERGWFLRSEIIWARLRPNSMPESVTDRPTKAHSTIFLLSKKPRYFFDADALRTPYAYDGRAATVIPDNGLGGSHENHANRKGRERWPGIGKAQAQARRDVGIGGHDESEPMDVHPMGANARSVWTIATEPTSFAHFATWPQKLVSRMIRAGTSERGCCPECGAPWVRQGIGWSPSCDCRPDNPQVVVPFHPPVPCTVLDPFAGSGTTLKVARDHGRHGIGIELNEDYCRIAADRLAQQSLLTVPTEARAGEAPKGLRNHRKETSPCSPPAK